MMLLLPNQTAATINALVEFGLPEMPMDTILDMSGDVSACGAMKRFIFEALCGLPAILSAIPRARGARGFDAIEPATEIISLARKTICIAEICPQVPAGVEATPTGNINLIGFSVQLTKADWSFMSALRAEDVETTFRLVEYFFKHPKSSMLLPDNDIMGCPEGQAQAASGKSDEGAA